MLEPGKTNEPGLQILKSGTSVELCKKSDGMDKDK
jgi:hypothetical protein